MTRTLRPFTLLAVAAVCVFTGCEQSDALSSQNGATPPLSAADKQDPKFREQFAYGLLIDRKIREGKTTLAEVRELFKDYPLDFLVYSDTLATFHFFPMSAEEYAIRAGKFPPGQPPLAIAYHGRKMDFHFNANGVVESITLSCTYKGIIDE